MDDTDSFSTETITVPIGFMLFAIAQLSLSYTIGKYIRLSGTWLYTERKIHCVSQSLV